MSNKEINVLIRKYLDGTCTPSEKEQVESWYLDVASKMPIIEKGPLYTDVKSALWQKLQQNIRVSKSRRRYIVSWAAAACVLISLSIGLYWFNHQQTPIEPGTTMASLTVADGTVYALDTLQTASHWSALTGDGDQSARQENAISTPKGGEFSLVLPDGSKVWLNAESKLVFPAAFGDTERVVSLTGEAYFEIAKNPDKPFKVQVNDAVVEVLGTHFNIESYPEKEAFKTTLIEGSVKISKAGERKVLMPGQQAIVEHDQNSIHIQEQVDVNKVMAWKEGFFEFTNDPIDEILEQIGRWYQVDIHYESEVPDKRLTGRLSRQSRFEQVLAILEYSGIHYALDDKTLIIYP